MVKLKLTALRVGKFMSDKPRPVIAKFLRFTDKQNILRNSRKLKGTNELINEDLCEASMLKRHFLMELMQAWGSGENRSIFSHTFGHSRSSTFEQLGFSLGSFFCSSSQWQQQPTSTQM